MDEKQAVDILKKYAIDEKKLEIIFNHSKAVQKLALKIAEEIVKQGNKVDLEFIKTASLLHDIGRFVYLPGKDSIKHGIAGADILRKEGLDEKYARVCETHVGSGIDKNDIKEQNLPIPLKDYMPKTVEEKIINYADSLIFGAREGTINEVIERYRKEVGEKLVEKTINLHNEIERLRGRNSFL